jgi:hypothetical protein
VYIFLQIAEGLCARSVWEVTYLAVLAQTLVLLKSGFPKAMTMKNAVFWDAKQPLFVLFSSLSYDRSKASSKVSSPYSSTQSFLFQMRVSSSFLKVIQ